MKVIEKYSITFVEKPSECQNHMFWNPKNQGDYDIFQT